MTATELMQAFQVLFSPCVLPKSFPLLGVLGAGSDTGQLMATVQRRLEAALAQGLPSQSADAACHALHLAAFSAGGMLRLGAAAGLTYGLPQGQQEALPQAPDLLQQLSGSAPAAVRPRLVLQTVQLVRAVVATADAVLRQGLWPCTDGRPSSQAEAGRARELRTLAHFLHWLGHSAVAVQPAAQRLTAALAPVAEAWLVVQARLLQLHAAFPPGARGNHSGSGGRDSSGAATSTSGSSDSADVMHHFKASLAQCSVGLSSLVGDAAVAAGCLKGLCRSTGSDAGTAGQHPLLHTMLQLVTAASITAHLAAGMVQAGDEEAQWAQSELLACEWGEAPALRAARQLHFALRGLSICFSGPWQLPRPRGGSPTAAALEAGG